MLKVENINRAIKGQQILEGINLNINQGEITVLIGPSGCGKTTLLRAMANLDKAQSGKIILDDLVVDLKNGSKYHEMLYPKVSIVFQQLFLWNHMSNRENIEFVMRQNKFSKEQIEKSVYSLVEKMQMSHFIERFPEQSSQGQRQRVALARAICLNPQYLLLDEITSALDIVQTRKVARIIYEFVHENKAAVFMSTHNISLAKELADKVIFMKDGQVIEYGTVEILNYPNSKELIEFLS